MIFSTTTQTLIIAHRGASAHAPENTLAAFQLAVAQGADAIELDAKLSLDGQIVVIHDQNVERTTNGNGKVGELTLSELQALDAGSWFSPAFAGEKIPTLRQVFEVIGDKLLINVELTNYASPGDALPLLAAQLALEFDWVDRILFSSFHPFNLVRIKKRIPNAQVALLALPGRAGFLSRSSIGRWFSPRFIHPHYTDISEAFIQKEHNRKRKVNAWTINDAGMIQRLLSWHIDGLITDDPRPAKQILEAS